LAGDVLASHYAAPVARVVTGAAALRLEPADDADELAQLAEGARFDVVEDSVGWAWGYAGDERRVGYVRSDVLSPAQS
jgi:hypothetical protein